MRRKKAVGSRQKAVSGKQRKKSSFLIQLLRSCVSMSFVLLSAFCFLPSAFSVASQTEAQPLSPPNGLRAGDFPYDEGHAVYLSWKAMPYDSSEVKYAIYVSESESGPFEAKAEEFPANSHYVSDQEWPFWVSLKAKDEHLAKISSRKFLQNGQAMEKPLEPGEKYYLRLDVLRGDEVLHEPVVEAIPQGNWFSLPKLNNLVYTLLFSAMILGSVSWAKRKELFLRRIAGLDAVEDAVGRATEMGKPVFFLTGRYDIDSVSTLAASIILGAVAKKTAAYGTPLRVPHTYALTMTVCQEITKEAYTSAGRPDAYHDDINFFITEDQFSYTAAVDGLMLREKPAACFYMGYYYAEALLLAETGASVGAIQIAGTDAEAQLPFFVTACDFTLIGEELYAASAYLSRDPVLVGTLRGQDLGKALVMVGMLVGTVAITVFTALGATGLGRILMDVFRNF